jgi:hypothetical protein
MGNTRTDSHIGSLFIFVLRLLRANERPNEPYGNVNVLNGLLSRQIAVRFKRINSVSEVLRTRDAIHDCLSLPTSENHAMQRTRESVGWFVHGHRSRAADRSR